MALIKDVTDVCFFGLIKSDQKNICNKSTTLWPRLFPIQRSTSLTGFSDEPQQSFEIYRSDESQQSSEIYRQRSPEPASGACKWIIWGERCVSVPLLCSMFWTVPIQSQPKHEDCLFVPGLALIQNLLSWRPYSMNSVHLCFDNLTPGSWAFDGVPPSLLRCLLTGSIVTSHSIWSSSSTADLCESACSPFVSWGNFPVNHLSNRPPKFYGSALKTAVIWFQLSV